MVKTKLHNDRLFTWAFDYKGVGVYTRSGPTSWLAVVGDQTIVTNDSWYLYEQIDAAV